MDTNFKQRLEDANVVRGGHFVYKAGDHGTQFVNKDAVVLEPKLISDIAGHLASAIDTLIGSDNVDFLIGLPLGALILAGQIGILLEKPVVYPDPKYTAEFDGGGQLITKKYGWEFKRGFDDFLRGRTGVIIEDVITTGSSVQDALATLEKQRIGCAISAVVAIYNRGAATADTFGVTQLITAVNNPLEKFPASECPLCARGVPINTDHGRGHEFVAIHGQPPYQN
jgi:orotate phosphoribosyltransferase